MKKVGLIVFFFILFVNAKAQTNKAILAHKNGNLKIAKAIVDSLSFLPAYDQDAELWYVKGMVYETIYIQNDSLINYINDHPLKVSLMSYKKAVNGSKNKKYTQIADKRIDSALCKTFLAESSRLVEKKNLADAIELVKLFTVAKPADTLGYVQLSQIAEKAKDNDLAKASFIKLIELGYHKPHIYKSLLLILIATDKNLKETEKYLKEAQAKYPLDFDFRKIEINAALSQKKYPIALKLTDVLIKEDNANSAAYLFNIGSIYQSIDSIQLAINYYEQAISADPERFEAYYNLGGIFYEKARIVYTKINGMDYGTYQKTGRKIEAEANDLVRKALPYFEKAWTIKKDEALKGILTDIYKNLKIKTELK
jgi:tetratricopeptide (TPR) repeat protein